MTDLDDLMGQICSKCGVGPYQETTIYDDWDGVLHCTNKQCNHEVRRYKWKAGPKAQPEKAKPLPATQTIGTKLSAAQTVLIAQARKRCLSEWESVNDPPCHPSDPDWNGCIQCIDRRGTAAALRAVVKEKSFEDFGTILLTAKDILAIADELETQP
jgi:hypothetical protein